MDQKEKKRWIEAKGRELQYTFAGINETSLVFDIGLYKGDWTKRIAKRYNPNIYGFEPITKFYDVAVKRFKEHFKIKLFNFGLGASTRQEIMSVIGDSSTFLVKKGNKQQTVVIRSIEEFISHFSIKVIDLVSINIQGGEYELMDSLFQTGLISSFDRILLQFHEYKDIGFFAQRKGVRKRLELTHNVIYSYDTVWDYWIKKT